MGAIISFFRSLICQRISNKISILGELMPEQIGSLRITVLSAQSRLADHSLLISGLVTQSVSIHFHWGCRCSWLLTSSNVLDVYYIPLIRLWNHESRLAYYFLLILGVLVGIVTLSLNWICLISQQCPSLLLDFFESFQNFECETNLH